MRTFSFLRNSENLFTDVDAAGVDDNGNLITTKFTRDDNNVRTLTVDGVEFVLSDVPNNRGGNVSKDETLILFNALTNSGATESVLFVIERGSNLNSVDFQVDSVIGNVSGNLTATDDLPTSAEYAGEWLVTSPEVINSGRNFPSGNLTATATFGTTNSLDATFNNAASDGTNATLSASINGNTFSGEIIGTGVEAEAAGGFFGAQAAEIAGVGNGSIGGENGVLIFNGLKQ